MKRCILTPMILCGMLIIAACGGNKPLDVSCDKPQHYQSAMAAPKVESPDDLDPLDELREMPLPEAAPRPERPKGSPCVDRPPRVRLTGGDSE